MTTLEIIDDIYATLSENETSNLSGYTEMEGCPDSIKTAIGNDETALSVSMLLGIERLNNIQENSGNYASCVGSRPSTVRH